jgi:hypothetical protein
MTAVRHDLALRRGQAGMTLVEILLAATIAGVVLVPVTAWLVMTVRTQEVANDQLDLSNATGLLRTVLIGDVASAALVSAGGSDCIGGQGSAGQVRLQILPAGGTRRVVYSEAPASGDPSRRSLWRRECNLTPDTLLSASELVQDVRPASTTASCPDASGSTPVGEDPCEQDPNRQVQLRTVPLQRDGADGPVIEIRALRRTSSASIGLGTPNNRSPVARIDATPLATYVGSPVVLSAQRSVDPDDGIEAYIWTLPPDAQCTGSASDPVRTCTFGVSGESSRTVQVTVKDRRGATNSAATTITILNRYPEALAAASLQPDGSFRLDGTASTDPEGGALAYRWDLGDDLDDARFLEGATAVFTFPPAARPGPRQVTLVVTDPEGATDAAIVQIVVPGDADPGDGGPGPAPGGIAITPTPVLVPGKLPRVGSVGGSVDSVQATFTSVDGASVRWRLLRHNTSTVVAEADGTSWTRTFGRNEAGDYDIVRITQVPGEPDAISAPRSFRVNSAPVAAFTATGVGPAPRSVSFSTGSASDPDGTIVSYRWNFGFFNVWTSTNANPVHTFTNPGTYVVLLEVVDDEGARSATFQNVVVPGAPFKAPTPSWSGDAAEIVPVPGAVEYRFTLTSSCGQTQVEVNASPAPRVLFSAGCANPGTVTAVVETFANGAWGPPSDVAVKP